MAILTNWRKHLVHATKVQLTNYYNESGRSINLSCWRKTPIKIFDLMERVVKMIEHIVHTYYRQLKQVYLPRII